MLFGKKIVITGVASGIGKRTAELAAQLGADVIGIDVRKPDVTVGHFVEGDIGSAAGVEAIAAALPRGIDALCNVAGISGKVGIVPTLAINFYGLRELSYAVSAKIREGGSIVNVASIAGYGWRANLERAKKLVAVKGFPDVDAVLRAEGLHNEFGYPLSKELLLLWNMQAAHEAGLQGSRHPCECGQPGPGRNADPDPVPRSARQSPRRQRYRTRRPRRHGRGHRAARALPLLGRRTLDQRRQHSLRRRA